MVKSVQSEPIARRRRPGIGCSLGRPHVDDVWRNKYLDTLYSHAFDRCVLVLTPMVDIKVLKRPRTEAALTQHKFFRKTVRGKVVKGVWQRT
jgi:hypothetical protein